MAAGWFGFGFSGFGQLDPGGGEEEGARIPSPRRLTFIPDLAEPNRAESAVRKVSPYWSGAAVLTGASSLLLWGFLGGLPRQSVSLTGPEIQGCKDLLASEKFTLLLFRDRVECWDTGGLALRRAGVEPMWKMELTGNEDFALPLVSQGYLIPKSPFFQPLSPQLQARKLTLGTEHALLLSQDGAVYSWGSGRHGQLGHGGVASETDPHIVEALQGVTMVDVAAGGWHSVSIGETGDIYIWGWNESGQLGFPSKRLSAEQERALAWQQEEPGNRKELELSNPPLITQEVEEGNGSGGMDMFISIQPFPALLDLPDGPEVTRVSCGSRHTCAVTREYGQLGHGDMRSSDQPKAIEYFRREQLCVLEVVCGPWNTFVYAFEVRTGREQASGDKSD
ncbi:RCC1 domain-containing protein 1 isoform X2 [Latimeria chalumnae]|uniref:RCC1 domain-containing protein 1 isoform X2 n=1 Tax=Latimeria chalumnae TaxID=7897 RepID=UPI00313DA385